MKSVDHSLDLSQVKITRVASPVRTQVLNELRRAIIEQRLRPGQHLVERSLIEQTGVSRATIREVLSQLAAEGLVTTVVNKGVVVASITARQAEELYQVRAMLEGMAARQFTERATAEQRHRLREALCEIEELSRHPDDLDAMLSGKARFYDILFAGAANATIQELTVGLQARVSFLRRRSLAQPGRPAQTLDEVRKIVDAVERHDPHAAADAAQAHVLAAARVVLATLASPADGNTDL